MTKKYFGWNYFGSQGKVFEKLSTIIKDNIGPFNKYVDLTAGGGSACYLFAKEGKTVYANDINYYAYLCNKTILCKNEKINFEEIEQIIPIKDFLYNNWKHNTGDSKLLKCNEQMVMWFDGALNQIKNPIILSCIGKSLINVYGYMGIPAMSLTTKTGKLATEILLDEFKIDLYKEINRVQQFMLNNEKNYTTNLDALNASQQKHLKDSIVYIDPAWPYAKGMSHGDSNPYIWYYRLAKILSLNKQKDGYLWIKTPDEQIMDDVKKWINNAFEQNANYFIINTQSTNRPNPNTLIENFEIVYGKENVVSTKLTSKKYKKLNDANYNLEEYYIIIKNSNR
jgi:adenine-specific DNA methylase